MQDLANCDTLFHVSAGWGGCLSYVSVGMRRLVVVMAGSDGGGVVAVHAARLPSVRGRRARLQVQLHPAAVARQQPANTPLLQSLATNTCTCFYIAYTVSIHVMGP